MQAKPRVLLVDDEEHNLEFLERVFRQGFSVACAKSGKDALDLLRRETFDVIVADQLMPGMSGVELLQRSMEYCPEAIRIVVTGYPDIVTAIASLNEGRAFRFFTKPIDASQLLEQVRRALGERELEQENARLREELRTKEEALAKLLREREQFVQAKARETCEELRQENERLWKLVTLDAETGTLQGSALQVRIEEEIARATRHSLACALVGVKILGWDAYARRHGTEQRGELVRMVVELIRLGSRRYDVLGRPKPDRFVLLLPMCNGQGALARAARLRDALAKFPFPGVREVSEFGLQIVTAAFPEDGREAAALMEKVATGLGEHGAAAKT